MTTDGNWITKNAEDGVTAWLAERCVLQPGAYGVASAFLADYAAWCGGRFITYSRAGLCKALVQRGLHVTPRSTYWRGMALRPSTSGVPCHAAA
jgi:hypothetical protein